jgi:hypothetical protein
MFGAAVLVAVIPSAAHADPAGCGGSGDIGINSTGLMTATAEAGCNGAASRTLVVEIKHDLSGQPELEGCEQFPAGEYAIISRSGQRL